MKVGLSSLEVTYLVKELQFLVGAKVEKIFQTEKPKDDFLFSLHVPSVGKQFLFVSLPNLFCLTSFKPPFPQVPPHFCSSLRRKITGAKITSIGQVDFERILKITFTTKLGLSDLIIEFLSPGNIILTLPEEDNKIIAVLHPKIWNQHRKILPNKPYSYPSKQLDPRTISKDDFFNLVTSSDRESIVKTLAIEVSLGGMFAKEVLTSANIEHSLEPSSISKEVSDKIFDSLGSLFNKEIYANVINGNALAFPLHAFDSGMPKDSFNDAISSLALSSLEKDETREYQKSSKAELSKVQKVIKAQSSALSKLEKSKDEKRKKGELIYSNYAQIKDVLDTITQMRKTNSWSEVKEHFDNHPFKIKIDEHKGTLTVEIDE